MSGDVDTAKIRARYETDGIWPEHVYALVCALDAARAERDMYSAELATAATDIATARGHINELEQLANRELDDNWCAVWQEVCRENDALEARIAAALEYGVDDHTIALLTGGTP